MTFCPSRVRPSIVAAMFRQQRGHSAAEQFLVHRRLALEHVGAPAPHLASLQGAGEGGSSMIHAGLVLMR